MDSLISTFHIDWKLMVAQLINFVVVIIVLWVFALKPLKKLMDERGETIKGGLENAKLQEKLLAEFKEKMDTDTREFGRELIEKRKAFQKDLTVLQEENQIRIEESSKKWIEDTKKGMIAEKNKVLEEAEREVGSLLLMLAEKAFGENMDEKLKAKLVETSIKEIK